MNYRGLVVSTLLIYRNNDCTLVTFGKHDDHALNN